MKTIVILLSLFFLFLFSSCAGVKIYSDAELTKPSAIKFHYPKPFLLVEKNANANGGKKASIVYLPDLSEAFYAKTKSGFGQSDLKLVFENGSLASYGIGTDAKIPETIAALSAALNTGLSQLPKLNADDKPLKTSDPDFELYAILILDGKMTLRKLEVKQ
ncbi:MAG: hypothetical protein CFE25_05155 [Chitinophagaceae bacterium BSSC1]|nr:MAG: hypothetical protein CFE25_05155 [Chitinophagaceae bacterium BSSC1]